MQVFVHSAIKHSVTRHGPLTICKRQSVLYAVPLHKHRPSFRFFVAERVSEFVGDGQIKKVIHSHRPLPDELYASRRDRTDQRLFEKRLPPIENAKRRAFGVHSVLLLERLPVV